MSGKVMLRLCFWTLRRNSDFCSDMCKYYSANASLPSEQDWHDVGAIVRAMRTKLPARGKGETYEGGSPIYKTFT